MKSLYLRGLIEEAELLARRLAEVRENQSGNGGPTASERAILLSLVRAGAQTVPQLARPKNVSRQHIQVLVNGLAGKGLVELKANPAHKRSYLVELTKDGKQVAATLEQAEGEWLDSLTPVLGKKETQRAIEALRAARAALGE